MSIVTAILVLLFLMAVQMVSTGIPELSKEENLDYLRAAFHSDLTVLFTSLHFVIIDPFISHNM